MGEQYPVVIKSWRDKQNPFVGLFIPPILWKGIIARKVTKTKGVFPNDDVLMKLVHLSVILFERSDHAIDKLRTKCIAIGHKVWRSIQYYVTFLPGRLSSKRHD